MVAGNVETLNPDQDKLSKQAQKVLKAGKEKADQSFKTTQHDLGVTVESMKGIASDWAPRLVVKEVPVIHNTYFEQEESVQVVLELLGRDLIAIPQGEEGDSEDLATEKCSRRAED